MTKEEVLLACLGISSGASHDPVHIQKIIFIFQERAKEIFDQKPFAFKPYDYGPFDPEIYFILDELINNGLVSIVGLPFERHRLYKLTEEGQKKANSVLKNLSQENKEFLDNLSKWARSLSFAQLVGAIYQEFPEMKINSIFRG